MLNNQGHGGGYRSRRCSHCREKHHPVVHLFSGVFSEHSVFSGDMKKLPQCLGDRSSAAFSASDIRPPTSMGAMRATGRPLLVTMISAPWDAISMYLEKRWLASRSETCCMAIGITSYE